MDFDFDGFEVITVVVVVAEISCWIWSGERQSTTMRIKYLEAVLNQDIQFFDTEVRTSDIVFVINTDAIMVQDAISEKVQCQIQQVPFFFVSVTRFGLVFLNFHFFMVLVQLGNFIHYMATFVSGFVVGFTAVWQLALVTLAVVPMIAVIGGIHTATLAKLSGKSQEALSQAGNIVEQVRLQSITKLRNFVNCILFELALHYLLHCLCIADGCTNPGSVSLCWGVQSIAVLFISLEDRTEDWLQNWVCKGNGIGCYLLCCFLLLRASAVVWRLSG